MARLPPGIPFILRNLLAVLAVPAVILYALNLLKYRWQFGISNGVVWPLAFASIPFSIATRIFLRYWLINRAAARIGATLPPRWDGKAFGHLDVLQQMIDSLEYGYPGDFAWKKFAELGPIVQTNILWDRMYITCDPHVIKTILATDFENYVKGETFSGFMSPVLGSGVFNSDGDMWKWHRSMTRPFFSKDRISDFELFDRHAEHAFAKMCEQFREGCAVDFQDLVSRFTLDSASEFLFGSCVHFLHAPLPFPHHTQRAASSLPSTRSRAEAFAEAFSNAQRVCSQRSWRGWVWPLFEVFENKSARHMRVVDKFLDPIVRDALRRRDARLAGQVVQGKGENEHDDGDDQETFLDNLVRYTSDPEVLHDEVLNILLAGRDTTAASLTFAVYFLCTHPDVLARLRVEVLETIGPSRRPTYEDIREMKYLRAVINETLRLYPAVPFNMRYSVNEGTLLNPDPNGKPFYVPPNTPVSYYVFVMHRSTEYWGPDAMEFDPDRFLDERLHKYLTPNPFIFLPFNAGPRICLGQQFAYNEISFFLIKLLQRFSMMELDLGAQPPGSCPPKEWAGAWGRKGVEKFWPKIHLTMYANGGLWVKMTEAVGHDSD